MRFREFLGLNQKVLVIANEDQSNDSHSTNLFEMHCIQHILVARF